MIQCEQWSIILKDDCTFRRSYSGFVRVYSPIFAGIVLTHKLPSLLDTRLDEHADLYFGANFS